MHTDHDDDYDPEHERFLDSGDDLDEMFADELNDDDQNAGKPEDAGESSFRDTPAPYEEDADEDDEYDEFHSGLDDDF